MLPEINLMLSNRFTKFLVVGSIGVFVNEALLFILTILGLHYLFSAFITVEVVILLNFLLNDSWTFKDRRNGSIYSRFVSFNGVTAFSLVIQILLLYFITEYLGINYLISNLIGIGAATLIRYKMCVKGVWN